VVARGSDYVFAQSIEDVAKFVGLDGTGLASLPPAELIGRYTTILRAVQRYLCQMPVERLEELVIHNRDRSVRMMGHHVFRIAEAFLETVVEGADYTSQLANVPPEDGAFNTGEELAAYGEEVISRLQAWWAGVPDAACTQKVQTFFGVQPVHALFERSTWHSAQHARQLIAVLERFGIEPDVRLTPADLAGLPLPEGLWE
jgi:hypothetical protein